MVNVEMILTGVFVGAVLATAGYFKTWMNSGEPLSVIKAIATMGMGAVVGFLMGYSGIPLIEENFVVQFGLFGVLTVIFEDILKGVTRPRVVPIITEGWTFSPSRGAILYEAHGWKVRLNPSRWVRHLPDEKVYQAISPKAGFLHGTYSGDKSQIEYLVKSENADAAAWRKSHE